MIQTPKNSNALPGYLPEQQLDPYDRLSKSCLDSEQYPANLLKKTASQDVIKRYQTYLKENEDVLFRDSKARLLMWEHWSTDHKYREADISVLERLTIHLDRHQKDPRCRHVFLESNNSRAPLNCEAAMLKYLLTYHQVDPIFLDALFSFGDQEEPVDACLSQFQYNDTLDSRFSLPPFTILGRSGRELRFSILLRAAEQAPEAEWPWSVRQAAAYHAFDVETGRVLWISVKGNDLLRTRIVESTSESSASGAMEENMDGSLTAALDVLLVYFSWCEENWRWYVRDIDDKIRTIMIKAKTAPIDREPHFTNPLSAKFEADLGLDSSKFQSLMKRPTFPVFFPEASEKAPGFLGTFRPRSMPQLSTSKSTYQGQPSTGRSSQRLRKSFVPEKLVLEMFNYKDLQDLNIMGEKVAEAILIIRLNLRVLEDVNGYYLGLMDLTKVPIGTSKALQKCIPPFRTRVSAIMRRLEIRQLQLESLHKKLDEGKSLFENLLQYRSLQVTNIFAEHGHESAKAMQKIAQRTAQDTVSMHIITILTLVFLPPTFVATFFQSGILEWPQSESGAIVGSWLFRSDAFALFLEIVLPMMAILFIAWLLSSWRGNGSLHRQFSQV